MPAELDNIDSEMDQPEMDQPEMDSEPVGGTIGLHGGETDREGAMAKADLFKIANYAHKLYQQLEDNDQLESWVQAKITKAADYIASVYHYLEYEMKFSEYGHHLDNSDTLSEGQKMRIKELLSEAKSKVKELKKAQAEKVSEEKSSTGGEIDRSTKGVTKHKENSKRFSDEEHTQPKSQAKSQSAADKEGDKAADKAEEKEGKNWQKRFGKDSVTRVKDGKKVDEALKGGQKKLDTDNDDDIDAKDLAALRARKKVKEGTDEKCNHTPKGKKCSVHGLKECGMYEAKKKGDGNLANNAKPYDKVTRGDVIAGRIGKDEKGGKTVKEAAKQTMSRAAKAGKEGKSLEPVKAKYNKYDENLTVVPNPSGADSADRAKELGAMMPAPAGKKDPISTTKESIGKKPCPPMSHIKKMCQDGKSVAEICKMHPNCDQKELKQMVADCKKKTVKEASGGTTAAAAMWKNMKETVAYVAERKKKEKVTDENLTVVPNPSGADSADRAKELGAMMPAPAGKKDPISTTKESFDLTRMRQLTGRLNQNEKPALVENREVDQIRALTKRLLG